MEPAREQIELAAHSIWRARGGSHGGDVEDWLAAETHLSMVLNYEIYRSFWLNGEEGSRVYFGNQRERLCRFCRRGEPEASFKTEAHAVPYFLGNRHLIAYDECDECNKYFSETLEDHLSKLISPFTSMMGIKGRRGIPKYKTPTGARIERNPKTGGILVKDDPENRILAIDPENRQLTLAIRSQAHVPIIAYKCLVKMGLAIMSEEELPFFDFTRQWILHRDHCLNIELLKEAGCIYYSIESQYRAPFVALLRRKTTGVNMPYMILLVGMGNTLFQSFLPICFQDDHLRPCPAPRFATHLDICIFGKPAISQVIEMGRCDVRRDQSFGVLMSYEEEQPGDSSLFAHMK